MTSGAELVIAAVSALSGLAAVATLAFSYWQWVRQGFLVSTSVRVAHDNQTIRVVIYNRGRLKVSSTAARWSSTIPANGATTRSVPASLRPPTAGTPRRSSRWGTHSS